MKLFRAYLVSLAFVCAAVAQQAKLTATPPPQMPAALVTPEVHPDSSVTFRFRAPNAQDVKLAREGAQPIAMQRDDQGVWSVTTPPLDPDYYGYSIIVDGQRYIDP